MSCSRTIRKSALLRDYENECPARVQGGYMACPETMRAVVLFGYKEDMCLAQGQWESSVLLK